MSFKISPEAAALENKLNKRISAMVIATKDRGYLQYWHHKMDKFITAVLTGIDLTEAETEMAHQLVVIVTSTLLIGRWCVKDQEGPNAVNFSTFEKTCYVIAKRYSWSDLQRLVRYLNYQYGQYVKALNAKRTDDDLIDATEYQAKLMNCLMTLHKHINRAGLPDDIGIKHLQTVENKLTNYFAAHYMINHHIPVEAYRLKRLSQEHETKMNAIRSHEFES